MWLLLIAGAAQAVSLAEVFVAEECPNLRAADIPIFVAFEEDMQTGAGTRGLENFLAVRWLDHSLCHDWIARHILRIADGAHEELRARLLVNLANLFKLVGVRNWYRLILADYDERGISLDNRRAPHARLYADIGARQAQFFARWAVLPKNIVSAADQRMSVSLHSICVYPQGSELVELASRNHLQYAANHDYSYSMTKSVEAIFLENPQFFKTKFLAQWAANHSENEWLLLIDCDAFFTNMYTRVEDLLNGVSSDTWLVLAEDSSGVNTGVLLVRGGYKAADFFNAVARHSHMAMSWDQSMLFFELLIRANLLNSTLPIIYPPPGVVLVHQANLNAYHEGSAKSWNTYAWSPGDFVKHFAGCPHEEPYCLGLMRDTVSQSDCAAL